ncbi:flavin reductase like domain-containing protein [Dipodascopsis tothii]|uniref:flavin reductase like domain-containing protein n=1 Tax=Dipodascopsis tothii TaxID=44089 RepID=UPI0034CF486E
MAYSVDRTATTDGLLVNYKEIMSKHSSPVVILTASYVDENLTRIYRAVTLSSLTSLSIDPEPLLTFNLRLPSSTSKALHSSGRFSINFLSSNPLAASLAECFSFGTYVPVDRQASTPTKSSENLSRHQVDHEMILRSFPLSDEPFKTSILNNSVTKYDSTRIAYARMDCVAKSVFAVEDNEIWVGKVERTFHSDPDSDAIIYSGRKFRSLGQQIERTSYFYEGVEHKT